MPPRKARSTASKATTTPKSSPSKPSAKAKGKRKAEASDAAAPSPRRRPRLAAPNAGLDDDDDGSDGEDAYRDDGDDEAAAQFVTASGGDAYMLYSTQTSRTSDTLLSTAVDPAFTLASYAAALRKYDTLAPPELAQEREARLAKARNRFARWTFDLEEGGFNVLITGVGSKRRILNEYAERVRSSRGDVVVVNGYDTAATLIDVVAALEDIVRARGGVRQQGTEEEEEEEALNTPRRTRRSPTKKGKGKATTGAGAVGGTYATARPVSALESRVRRLCSSLRLASTTTPAAESSSNQETVRPIYLVIHSLDGPVLRLPKNIALLALLAAQPHVHVVASVDHVRSSLLFPTALAAARPPFASSSSSTAAAAEDLLHLSYRAFTWIHYDCPTLVPYDVELASLGTLSTLLPPSVFPPLSTSLDPTAASLAQSATHVLASVTDRARRLFNLLGQEQVRMAEALPREVERGMRLLGQAGGGAASAAGGGAAAAAVEKAPAIAISLAS
jgi:origin recognition complex subunit 2